MGYIDRVILRDRDMADDSGKVEFDQAGNGKLEERVYYCQNQRHDVSSVLEYSGCGSACQVESVKYFTYGTPFALPAGDFNSDGEFSASELSAIAAWSSGYDARADADLDGVVDSADATILGPSSGTDLGRGELSRADIFNRKGFRGWDNDGSLADSNTVNLYGTKKAGNSRFWVTAGGVFDSTLGITFARADDNKGKEEGGSITWGASCLDCLLVFVGEDARLARYLARFLTCFDCAQAISAPTRDERRAAMHRCAAKLGLADGDVEELLKKAIGIEACAECLSGLVPKSILPPTRRNDPPPVVGDPPATCHEVIDAILAACNKCNVHFPPGNIRRNSCSNVAQADLLADCDLENKSPAETAADGCEILRASGCGAYRPSWCNKH